MGEGVVRDRMAFGEFAPHEFGQRLDLAADQKNVARTHSAASASSTFGVDVRVRPSSKVRMTSWSASGIVFVGLQADLQAAFGSDADDARGAELVRAALGGRGGAEAGQQRISARGDQH